MVSKLLTYKTPLEAKSFADIVVISAKPKRQSNQKVQVTPQESCSRLDRTQTRSGVNMRLKSDLMVPRGEKSLTI